MVSSLDVIKPLIGSDSYGHEVDTLMIGEKEVDSPLKEREESSNSITVDSSCEDSK